jgi:serine/threonine protein kinase
MRPLIGQRFNHYEVVEPLGKGGMGEVYRARDTRLDRSVALKVLPKEFSADPDRKRRFIEEAKAACAVTHPAIAQIYDADEVDGTLFIAMELVEGKTVRSLIRGRELDVLGAVEIALQVASGLAKAHEAGIVHRDIKSDNIMVTSDGHAKILDFGLAKLLETPSSGGMSPNDELSHMETVAKTQAGMVVGTLRYMSPEQARGQAVDHRSDLFSLGVVLYEMVTSQLPFEGSTPLDTLHAIAFEETRPVTSVRANLPPSLQRVVSRCLRKRSQDRYTSARELIADLKTVQREVESGVSSSVSIGARLKEGWQSLRALPLSEWNWPLIAMLLGLLVLVLLLSRDEDIIPKLLMLGMFGLLGWRFVRNRRYRLLRRFSNRAQKLPEVSVIAVDGQNVTVIADKAVARTYVRVNAAMETTNAKLFFGDPFSVVVRDGLSDEEIRGVLSGPGVVYVRRDLLEGEPGLR